MLLFNHLVLAQLLLQVQIGSVILHHDLDFSATIITILQVSIHRPIVEDGPPMELDSVLDRLVVSMVLLVPATMDHRTLTLIVGRSTLPIR